jgi:hypothetical protein
MINKDQDTVPLRLAFASGKGGPGRPQSLLL